MRPILEYCSPIWSPVYKSDIVKLEKVQRRFTKRLKGCSLMSYEERRKLLKAETLELRRLKQDLTTMYKIINNLIDVNTADLFEFSTDIRTRGHNLKIVKPVCNNNARAFSFACRRINSWNSLPEHVVTCKTVAHFKHSLDYVNFNNYLYI